MGNQNPGKGTKGVSGGRLRVFGSESVFTQTLLDLRTRVGLNSPPLSNVAIYKKEVSLPFLFLVKGCCYH